MSKQSAAQVGEMQVRIARDLRELSHWEPAYGRFLNRLEDYRLFYRRGWLEALWPAWSLRPSRLFFIGVWQDGELAALAPFQQLRKGALQGWRRVLCFIGTQHPALVNPWPDILLPADEARRTEALQAIAATLDRHAREWDSLELCQWPAQSPNLSLLRRHWSAADFQAEPEASLQIDLAQGHAAYSAGLSKSMLREARRLRRRLEEQGQVALYETATISEARWQAISALHLRRQARLSEKGWDRYSVFADPREAAVLRAAMDWAAREGKARHYWLDLDGEPLAFGLGLGEGRSYVYYMAALDERAETWSGGVQILLHLVEAEAARGTQHIDLMYGLSWYKRRVSNAHRPLLSCRHDNPRPLSALRNAWVDLAKSRLGKPSSAPVPPGPPPALETLPGSVAALRPGGEAPGS